MHLHHSKTRRKSLLQLELVIFLLSTLLCCTYSLMCYECFDTGPTNLNCTRQDHNCTGSACILYESGDNKTSSAFCLLTTFSLDSAGDANAAHPPKNGCWMEADGQGKHCICSTDFCNRLRDRTHKTIYDSTASPLPELEFLKQNPFIDYEYIEDERSISDGPISKSKNSSQTYHFEPDSLSDVDHEDESDLVPVDFDAYQDEWLKRGNDSLSADPLPHPIIQTARGQQQCISDRSNGR